MIDTAGKTGELVDKLAELKGAVGMESAALQAAEALDTLDEKYLAVLVAERDFGKGSEEASDAERELAQQVVTTKGQLIDYAESLENVPPAVMTEFQALVNKGDLAGAQALLDEAAMPGDQPREAALKAQAKNTRPTDRELTHTARPRDSAAHQKPHTGLAEDRLNTTARSRDSKVTASRTRPTRRVCSPR